jgi:hypothetical protein
MLLTSLASLAQLNGRVAETAVARGEPAAGPIAMSRFRPNVVIHGGFPFAEDGWARLRLGAVSSRSGEAAVLEWPNVLRRRVDSSQLWRAQRGRPAEVLAGR